MLRPITLAAAILAGLAIKAQAAELTVSITGATPAQGQFLVSVFDTSDTWMKTPVVSYTLDIAADGSYRGVFDLPAAAYAIALIHDVNGNGEMDTNALGIPIEAFGFSNGARARFGPPSFAKAAFTLPETGGRQSISLDVAKR